MKCKDIAGGCAKGGCDYRVIMDGDPVLKPEQFLCPKGILNPQFPVYVVCKDRIYENEDVSLCQEFRDARRAVLRKSRIPFPRYIDILKQRTHF